MRGLRVDVERRTPGCDREICRCFALQPAVLLHPFCHLPYSWAYAAEQGAGRGRHLPTLHIPPDRTLFVYPVVQVARVVRVEHRMRLQDLAPEVPGVSIEDDDIIAFSRREHAPVNRSTVGALA